MSTVGTRDNFHTIIFRNSSVGKASVPKMFTVGTLVEAHEGGSSLFVFGAVRVVVVYLDVDGSAIVVEGDDKAVLLLIPPDLVTQELLPLLGLGVALQRSEQVAVTND